MTATPPQAPSEEALALVDHIAEVIFRRDRWRTGIAADIDNFAARRLTATLLDPSEEVVEAGRAALASIEGWKLTPGTVFLSEPLTSVKMVRDCLRAAAMKITGE